MMMFRTLAVVLATVLFTDVNCQFLGGSTAVKLIWTARDPVDGTPTVSSTQIDTEPGTSVTTETHYSFEEPRNWTSLTNDYTGGFVFWMDRIGKQVWRGYFDTHASSIRTATSTSVQGVAADWLSKVLYYCDATYDWIFLIDYEGDLALPVIDTGLDKPHGIAVYPQRGYLFWTDWGRSPKIERATLAGKNRVTLVDTGLYQPNGIAVDYTSERLFWVETGSSRSRLETCDLNGGNRRTVTSIASINGFYFDLAIHQDTIFISDWKNRKIRYINKNDGTESYTLDLEEEPYGLTVYGPDQLPTDATPAPCSSNPCEHFCVSSSNDEGFQCLCLNRYVLQSDGRTCINDGSLAKHRVYVVTADSICSTHGNFLEVPVADVNITCNVENREFAVALVMDVRAQLMFFSDIQRRLIHRVRLFDGEAIQVLTGGTESVEGMAVDWLNENIYWTDSGRRHIAVSRYDGSRRHILIEEDVLSPRSIVIHAGRRLMFWSELLDASGNAGQIEKAGLDGQNRQVIVVNVQPSGLAIDFELERLYFADRVTSSISYVDFNGNGRTVVYTRAGAEYFDLAINKDYLLWTEWGDNDPNNRGIRALHLETGEFVTHVPTDADPYDVNVYDIGTQPDDVAVCGQDNGGCQHLCLPRSSGGFVCACATGYTPGLNGICETDVKSDNFLLMTDFFLRAIFQFDLDDPELPYTALPIDGLENPFAFTYDPVDKKVYWSDLTSDTINRANLLDGGDREVLLGPYNGIRTPEGLALEPISRLLFWTDLDRDSISVCKLDGSNKKTLISSNLDRPRGIVLDHINGIMFWSDWGSNPKIERAHLDGSNRETVLNTNLAAPNGLALDLTTSKLFFCDPYRRTVERVNTDGTNRENLLTLPQGYLPIGITLYQDAMLISDWSIHNLIYAQQNGANAVILGPEDFGRINFVLAYSAAGTTIGDNSCAANNGGCSDLCLPTPNGRTCACSDGATLQSNGVDCDQPTSTFLCPQEFPNGRVGSECDRATGSSCVVQCDTGYESAVGALTCGLFSNWDYVIYSICRAINPCNNNPCFNEGTCLNEASENADYTCVCVPGWVGLTCNINPNDCGSSPCNGGSCEDGLNSYTCKCREGTSGDNCEIGGSPDPCANNPCLNSGICVADSSGSSSFTCSCRPGYTGTRCEQDINECASNPCLNSGLCTNQINKYMCSCRSGFSGTRCEIISSPDPCANNPCLNSGICVADSSGSSSFTCSCRPGYLGTLCEQDINECASNPCLNSGSCTNQINAYMCSCRSGFSGTRCEIISSPDPCANNPCLNSGICVADSSGSSSFTCSCRPGYTGTVCEQDINECASNPCLNSGSCTNQINAYMCSCRSGFSGTRCEIISSPDPCTNNPCLNSGICVAGSSGSSSFTCSCVSGYTGTLCDQGVSCPPLQPPVNGRLVPTSCQSTSSGVGGTCQFMCLSGDYVLNGPQYKICMADGTWSQEADITSCIFEDTTPPVFITSCPFEMNVKVDEPCLRQTIVTFPPPMATDNSGQVTVTPSTTTSELLAIGRYVKTYRAEDESGNSAQCEVVINVVGVECGSPPQASQFGFISSKSCLQAFGSVATYVCFPGYQLIGNDEVQCGIDGGWSGSAPICQELYCDALELPANGNVSPRSCSEVDTIAAGTRCSVWCDDNYGFTGADASVTCTDGAWTDDLTNAVCQDVSAPTFINCPDSFEAALPPSADTVKVTWIVPMATINGKDVTPVQTDGITPPVRLTSGRVYQMEYVARDGENGPESYCRFTIKIKDTEAPTVVYCPEETITLITPSFPFTLGWDEPEFTDNVKVTEILQDGTPGMEVYTWGSVLVRYAAFDASDNLAECVVVLDVIQSSECQQLEPPVNGNIECDEPIGEGAMCSANCNAGYGFIDRNKPRGPYVCLETGMWSHATAMNPRPQLPACVEITNDNRLKWTREDRVVLGGWEQCNGAIHDPVREAFLAILETSSWMASCIRDPDNDCQIGDVNIDCGEEGRRRKRQTTEFNVKYQLIGHRNDSSTTEVLEESMAISAADLLPGNGITINVQGQNVVFDVIAAETGPIEASCDPGQDLIGLICVSCPVGTSHDIVASGCSPCDVGTYQDQEGQLICKSCPDGTTTTSTGSYDADQCKESCLSGHYSYLGVTPCEPCPAGSFQPQMGQRGCQQCGEGKTTVRSGATSDDLCVAIGSFTYPPTTINTEDSGEGSRLPLTAIIVGAIAVVLVIMVIGFVACCTCRRRTESQEPTNFLDNHDQDDMGRGGNRWAPSAPPPEPDITGGSALWNQETAFTSPIYDVPPLESFTFGR